MRNFNVYSDAKGKLKAVKNGWCWPAFFFGSFWSLFSGFILAAIIMLPIELFLNAASRSSSSGDPMVNSHAEIMAGGIIGLVILCIRLVYGFRGNKWRKARYIRSGFEFRGAVSAKNKEEAAKALADNPV